MLQRGIDVKPCNICYPACAERMDDKRRLMIIYVIRE
mgnify:CR=1 FL=1